MGTPRMPLVACTLQTKQAQTYVTDIRKTGLEGEIIAILSVTAQVRTPRARHAHNTHEDTNTHTKRADDRSVPPPPPRDNNRCHIHPP